ncbi:hypothetical protein ES703_68347 [subsurface metagenome]
MDKAWTMKKGKKDEFIPPFVRFERKMFFESSEWRELTGAEKLLYIYIKAKYNGSNDGRIKLTYGELKGAKGLSSSRTFAKAQRGLIKKGWITRSKFGGLYRYYNLYQLTWKFDSMK